MKKSIYLIFFALVLFSFSGKRSQAKNPPVFSKTLTPDNDGQNDVFAVEHLDEYPDNELTVFSRWGNEVHKSSPYKGDWNGSCSSCKNKDEKLPTGVYSYVFVDKQTEVKYSGFLTIQI